MAEWGAFHLTKQGTALVAAAHNGRQLSLSAIVLGSGELADGKDTYTLTSLVKQEQEFYIRDVADNGDGTFTVTARINNNGLAAGYRIRECGIIAETYSYDDEGQQIMKETLFGTAQATEPDYMPPPTAATMVDSEMRITIVISSDANVTATIDYDAYATIKYSDAQDSEWYEKAVALAKTMVKKALNGLDLMPVGTILAFSGDLSKIPNGWHICDGTDGTPNLVGRFLEGVTSGAGTMKAPGLPNITGYFYGHDVQMGWDAGGAMQKRLKGSWNDAGGSYHANWWSGVNFNASWSSAIYGASNTVQPASYTVYYIIKQKNVTIEI